MAGVITPPRTVAQELPALDHAHEILPRRIGFWGGSAIMVGIIIGSGIFKTPTSIAQQLGNPSLVLFMWVIGGMLSLFGAFTYAELGTMFPRSGGIYVYINEGFGELVAFVFGWTYMLLVKPLAAGGICMVFADHVNLLLGVDWDTRATTCITLLLLTAVNTMGVGIGANFAILLTGLKTAALAAIVLVAVAMTKGEAAHFVAAPAPVALSTGIIAALSSVLWTYDGWSDVASVAGEVKNPQRLLPKIFTAGTATCIGLYVAVNAVYIWMIGLEQMRGVPTVAPIVMEMLLGKASSVVLTVIIIISTLGATHCSIITGARVTFAQARDGLLFRALGRVHPRYRTPDVSLWVQAILSCVAVIALRDFDRITSGFVFMMWIFYAMAAAALIVLRIRRPHAERSYRCFGYPFVPILFIASAAVMTTLEVWGDPRERLPWLGVLVAAIPAYYIWRGFQRRRTTNATPSA
jgi:APA family basic amino acid/polyamine antiporter